MNFDFSCLVSLQSIFLTCMAIRVVGGACPVHEEKRGVVNLTYKAIVSFTRIAANVHTECPTNVETLPWREEKELFVTDFSVFFLSPPPILIYLPRPPTPHTHSVGGYKSGRDRFLLLTSFQSFKSVKLWNYKGRHCAWQASIHMTKGFERQTNGSVVDSRWPRCCCFTFLLTCMLCF